MNECIAFNYLTQKGLRDFQAAGVVGNLVQESGLNPRAAGDGGISHGIAQWNGPRWQALNALAQSTGRDPWSLDLQLDYLWRELPAYGLAELRATTSVEDATVVFQNRFEKCGDCRTPARIASARAALNTCQAVAVPEEPSSAGGFLVFLLAASVASYAALRVNRR